VLGLAPTPQSELIVDPLSLCVEFRAPVLARGFRRLARAAAIRKLSVAQYQQERRRFFVNEKMFRNIDHVLAQLETRQISLIEDPRCRVQAQGENLDLHFPSRAFGLRALLRDLAGRGLRARPARSLRERTYDNKFTSKGQVSNGPSVNDWTSQGGTRRSSCDSRRRRSRGNQPASHRRP